MHTLKKLQNIDELKLSDAGNYLLLGKTEKLHLEYFVLQRVMMIVRVMLSNVKSVNLTNLDVLLCISFAWAHMFFAHRYVVR